MWKIRVLWAASAKLWCGDRGAGMAMVQGEKTMEAGWQLLRRGGQHPVGVVVGKREEERGKEEANEFFLLKYFGFE